MTCSGAKWVCIIMVLLSSVLPWCLVVCNSNIFRCMVLRVLSFPFSLFISRSILNEPLLGPIRPVCFCIPQFWFLLAGGLDVVDRWYLKGTLVIARSVRRLCGWQMGTGNVESAWTPTYSSRLWVATPASISFSIRKFQKNYLAPSISFEPVTKSRLWLGSLPPPLLPPHYIVFGMKRSLKMLVQAGMNGCQQFLQTC